MEKEMVREVKIIPIEKLHPNPWNPNEMDEETEIQLMNDINENGFKDPLTVRPMKYVTKKGTEQGFQIIDGGHRYKKAKELGYKELPCIVDNEEDEGRARIKTIRWNKERGTFNPLKLAQNIEFLQKKYNLKQLEKLIGFKETELKDYLKLLDLPSDVKAMIKKQQETEAKIMPTVLQFVVSTEDEKFINVALNKAHFENRAEALKYLCECYLTPEEQGKALKKIAESFVKSTKSAQAEKK